MAGGSAGGPLIRPALPGDSHAAAVLLHDFNTEFSSPTPGVKILSARIRLLLEAGDVAVLLAGEPPCGLALARMRRSIWGAGLDATLEELYVAPPERGRGLGRALLTASLAGARAAGALRMEVGTSESDTAARGLYESCGFSNREGGRAGPRMLFYEREL